MPVNPGLTGGLISYVGTNGLLLEDRFQKPWGGQLIFLYVAHFICLFVPCPGDYGIHIIWDGGGGGNKTNYRDKLATIYCLLRSKLERQMNQREEQDQDSIQPSRIPLGYALHSSRIILGSKNHLGRILPGLLQYSSRNTTRQEKEKQFIENFTTRKRGNY